MFPTGAALVGIAATGLAVAAGNARAVTVAVALGGVGRVVGACVAGAVAEASVGVEALLAAFGAVLEHAAVARARAAPTAAPKTSIFQRRHPGRGRVLISPAPG